MMDRIERITAATRLEELYEEGLLPEPYDDGGFFLVYYAKEDYKTALCDIVRYAGDGLRIYYDRYLESGEWHERDFVARAKSTHCRAVVFYLSEAAIASPTLCALAAAVEENNIPYLSVNIGKVGGERSGAAMAEAAALPESTLAVLRKIFAPEITFLPAASPIADKLAALKKTAAVASMRYILCGDHAVAAYVRDPYEEEITIPPYVEIDGISYPVRGIGPRAFSGCRRLRHIRFPEGLTEIGEGCANPSDAGVFTDCESLCELVFPKGVRTLYGGMLRGCRSLSRLILPDDIALAGDPEAIFDLRPPLDSTPFSQNADGYTVHMEIAELHLPRAVHITVRERGYVGVVVTVGDNFVYRLLRVPVCTGGTTVRIKRRHKITHPAEVFAMGHDQGVVEVDAAEDFYFGDGWYSVFEGCTALERVTLPNTVLKTRELFRGCEALRKVTLPPSLAEIGEMTFAGCRALSSLTLPRYLFALEENAFVGCGLDTLVSDSIYSEYFLSGGLPYPYRVATIKNRFLRGIVKALMRLYTRLTDPDVLSEKPFYMWGNIRTIYITDEVRPLKLYGFREVKSDRKGYRLYRSTLSGIERLRYMEERIKRSK